MNISRRGFLGTLTAFVAAAAAGRTVTSHAAPLRKPCREQTELMAMLKDCRVVSVSRDCSINGMMRLEVNYVHAPGAPRTSLDDMADEQRKGMLPVSASITQECDSIDVTTFAPVSRNLRLDRPRITVQITFV